MQRCNTLPHFLLPPMMAVVFPTLYIVIYFWGNVYFFSPVWCFVKCIAHVLLPPSVVKMHTFISYQIEEAISHGHHLLNHKVVKLVIIEWNVERWRPPRNNFLLLICFTPNQIMCRVQSTPFLYCVLLYRVLFVYLFYSAFFAIYLFAGKFCYL